MPKSFAFDHPDDALRDLADRLTVVDTETRANGSAVGRVLATDVVADRASPAADVSAMDGYAVRMSDLQENQTVAVVGQCVCGSPPPEMPESGSLRIFTGAIVPAGCQAVVKREETIEGENEVTFTATACENPVGANIRRMGENAAAGSVVLERGTTINGATIATMANFGCFEPSCFRPVRVSILTTGDEVLQPEQTPQPWQLRNSNQAALKTLLGGYPWVDIVRTHHAVDDKASLAKNLAECLGDSDAVIMTGGVSMGDYDYVPDVVRDAGAQIAFHGLPIRPGKPILGAVTQTQTQTGAGKLIVGLPGNPVSAVVNGRRMVVPLLAKISGQTQWFPSTPAVQLKGKMPPPLGLFRMPLVRLIGHGEAELVPACGSGDLVALGQSDGFIEIAPNTQPTQPSRFFAWP